MKIKEMIGKIYKACLTKEALAALEAKAAQEEEEKYQAFVAEYEQKLVPLGPLAQAILNIVKARLEEGQATCNKEGVSFGGRWCSYVITDTVASQAFSVLVTTRGYFSRVRGVLIYTYQLTSPIALPTEEGNTLARYIMEHWYKVKVESEAKHRALLQEQELQSLTTKYMGNASVTKE